MKKFIEGEKKEMEEVKEDEFEEETPANIEVFCKTDNEQEGLGKQIKVYTGDIEERSLDLDPNLNELALNLNFFTDNRVNTVYLRFDYAFSQ